MRKAYPSAMEQKRGLWSLAKFDGREGQKSLEEFFEVERRNKVPSRKYVTLEGEGVCEGVTVCDRGRGSKEYVTSHFAKKNHRYET